MQIFNSFKLKELRTKAYIYIMITRVVNINKHNPCTGVTILPIVAIIIVIIIKHCTYLARGCVTLVLLSLDACFSFMRRFKSSFDTAFFMVLLLDAILKFFEKAYFRTNSFFDILHMKSYR